MRLLATGRFLTIFPTSVLSIFHRALGVQGLACQDEIGPGSNWHRDFEKPHAQPSGEAVHRVCARSREAAGDAKVVEGMSVPGPSILLNWPTSFGLQRLGRHWGTMLLEQAFQRQRRCRQYAPLWRRGVRRGRTVPARRVRAGRSMPADALDIGTSCSGKSASALATISAWTLMCSRSSVAHQADEFKRRAHEEHLCGCRAYIAGVPVGRGTLVVAPVSDYRSKRATSSTCAEYRN